mgnify:CR=1 FL=1
MIVARGLRNSTVVGSVYGLTYTSTNPLATFSVQRNLTTNLIEVVSTPSVTASGTSMYYSVSSTEMTTWD